ncbi:Isy1-domain-containing protein [Cystobasidium minutum MCA 4210]|uniref:Isy1-domain-containing protein n=1 Tax=Cystobasidium minutum MCA 4210 TaxID=1397322 RepID=UPI0034CDB9BF|eukprot:jgi/Rhomi1/168705/fgenesh1_kg.3_\
MARNEEKAQSMLYRFRQAKAMEMGLGGAHSDRRPRIAASCKDLRQCERWRGEILREISRKVTKIQDYGLSDYEVRDLNDEINKLMREKMHWENQIVALGGANYKRAAKSGIKDKDGREVPGTRGYKYFGRAKELPGVKELFSSAQKDQDELTSYKTQRYAAFEHVGPEYYGDLGDEAEDAMMRAEREAEEEEWEDAVQDVADTLGLQVDALGSAPMPRADYITLPVAGSSTASTSGPSSGDIPPPPPPLEEATEEPQPDAEAEPEPAQPTGSKRKTRASAAASKGKGKKGSKASKTSAAQEDEDMQAEEEQGPNAKAARTNEGNQSASGVGKIYTVLKEEHYKMPELPSLQDLESFLVAKQKEELLKEYV